MGMTSFDLQIADRRIGKGDNGDIEVREKYIAQLDIAETNPYRS